jgi:hypothetical protein
MGGAARVADRSDDTQSDAVLDALETLLKQTAGPLPLTWPGVCGQPAPRRPQWL